MALSTTDLFDDIGVLYDAAFADRTEQLKSLEWMLFQLPPHSKVLDIGCGPGSIAAIISERGHDVLGIDVSQVMVDAARKRVPGAAFSAVDFLKWPTAPDQYDAITMYFALISNVSRVDIRNAISKIHSMLRKGGIFVYASVAVSGETVHAEFFGRPIIASGFNAEETLEMVKAAGFEIEQHSEFLFQPQWVEGLCRPEEVAEEPHVFVCARRKNTVL